MVIGETGENLTCFGRLSDTEVMCLAILVLTFGLWYQERKAG